MLKSIVTPSGTLLAPVIKLCLPDEMAKGQFSSAIVRTAKDTSEAESGVKRQDG